jgi:hypothetical protein
VKENKALGSNTTKLPYHVINKLLYFNNNEIGLRLYIPTLLEKEVFELAYNKIGYLGYTRTYKYLTKGLYIYNIVTKLYKFIRYYLYY